MKPRFDIGDRVVAATSFGLVRGRVAALIPGHGYDMIDARGRHWRVFAPSVR